MEENFDLYSVSTIRKERNHCLNFLNWGGGEVLQPQHSVGMNFQPFELL